MRGYFPNRMSFVKASEAYESQHDQMECGCDRGFCDCQEVEEDEQ